MKAVIPCAKKKEALFPFTESKPTGLLPVMGKPLIKHTINALQELGVDDIYLVTNHLENEFEAEFGEYTNVNLIHQDDPSGTADAIQTCDFIDEDFFVVNGDVLVSEQDLESLKEKHDETGSQATVLATSEDKPEKFGVLSITNDRVKAIEEKPADAENTLVNTGIYIFSPAIFDRIEESESSDLTDAVKATVEQDDARFEIAESYWMDIDENKKVWRADKIKRQAEITETQIDDDADVHEDATITGDAVVKDGAEIRAGTVIEGQTYIGEDAAVGPNSVIRDCTVGKRSQIRDATLENTFTFEENIVDPKVFVENTVLAEDVDILSGTCIRESFIGPRSFVDVNNSIRGVKFVPDARTDLSEISK